MKLNSSTGNITHPCTHHLVDLSKNKFKSKWAHSKTKELYRSIILSPVNVLSTAKSAIEGLIYSTVYDDMHDKDDPPSLTPTNTLYPRNKKKHN